MADGFSMRTPNAGNGPDPVEQNIIINISGEEKLKSFARTLNTIARGTDLHKYWKSQESLINDVTDAYKRYQRYASESNGKELIANFNALRASGADVTSVLNNYSDVLSVFNDASSRYSALSNVFSLDNFRDMMDSFEFMRAQGVNISETLNRMDEAASLGGLQKALNEANRLLDEARAKIRDLESGESVIKANAFDKLVQKQKKEFSTFINANDVYKKVTWMDQWDNDKVNEYFAAVSNGSMTAKEAISKFKAELPHLLSFDMSGGGTGGSIDESTLSIFVAKIEGVLSKLGELRTELQETSSKVDEVKGLIGSIGTAGTGGSGGISTATGNIDSLTAAIERFAQVLEQVIPALEKFQGLNLNLSLGGSKSPMQKNAEYGMSARETIANLKEQAKAIEEYISAQLNISDAQAALTKLSGGRAVEVFDWYEKLTDKSKANNLSETMSMYKEYIKFLKDIASVGGVDLSPVMSSFSSSADSLIEGTKKVLTGENDTEEALTKLKALFGSGESSGPAFDPTTITEPIDRLIDALNRLRETARSLDENLLSDKFENIKGAKELLSSMAEYLPAISQVDVSKVAALASIDWANWTNFKVDTSSLEKFEEMMSKLSGAGGVYIHTEGENQYSSKELVEGTSRYYRALSAVDKALVSARENMRKWTAASDKNGGTSAEDYKKLAMSVSELTRLRDDILSEKEGLTGSKFHDELDRIKSDIDEATNAMSSANERFNADKMAEGTLEYSNALTQVSNTIKGIESQSASFKSVLSASGVGKQEIGEFDALVGKLINLREIVESGGISKNDFKERLAEIKKEASELSEKLSSMSREQQSLLIPNTKSYNDALSKLNSMLVQVASNSEKWTAAKNGSSSSNYEVYVAQGDAIRELINDIQNGNITQEEFKRRSSEISRVMKENEAAIRSAGEATTSFGNNMKSALSILLRYFSATRLIMSAVRYMKEMVNASMDIESAMTRIQIVTGATDSQMNNFFEATAEQSKALGKALTDVAGSIETFSRLGYSIDDASNLSKYATIMSNVADVDVDSATTGLTAIIKGFDLQASDAEHVSDVLIQVGQKYAISAEELMEAFERGGAALSASGTSFEKSAALFAATNASLQNASTTGTMWKTVSARIRGATTELSEMGEETEGLANGLSKYRDEIMSLSGVDIMIDDDTYKDMFDIFVELSSAWNNIESDTSRARIAEILGGTRNLSGVASTIQNIADAVGAYSDAMDSANVSEEANAKYMDTARAHLEQLSATFQEVSHNIVNTDFIKAVIDAIKVILETVDLLIEKFGILNAIPIAGITLLLMNIKNLNGFTSLGDFVTALSLSFESLSSSAMSAFGALQSFGGLGTIAVIAAIGVAVYGLIRYFDKMSNSVKNAKDQMEKSISEYQDAKSKLESVTRELEEAESALSALESVDAVEYVSDTELEKLREAVELLRVQEEIARRTEVRAAQKAASDVVYAYKTEFKTPINQSAYDEYYTDNPNLTNGNLLGLTGDYANVSAMLAAISIFKRLRDEQEKGSEKWQEYNDSVNTIEDSVWDQVNTLSDYKKTLEGIPIDDLTSEQKDALKSIGDSIDFIQSMLGSPLDSIISKAGDTNNATITMSDGIDGIRASADLTNTSVTSLTESIGSLMDILSKQQTGKSISLEDYNAEGMESYKKALEYTNGTMQINAEKALEIAKAKADEQEAVNNTEKAYAQLSYLENAKKIEELRSKIRDKNFAEGESESSIRDNINALVSENSQIADVCKQYDLLTASLQEAVGAYSNWLNAQSASDYGDMFNDAEEAVKRINDTYDEDSDIYGDFGSKKFSAALDFIVPDSVDKNDTEAVEKYMKQLAKYFMFDEDGEEVGMNIEQFCRDAVDKGLMVVDEASGEYKIAGNKTMEDFAEGLGLSSGMVQAFFDEMQLKGGEFDWGDEAIKTFGDLAVEAYEAKEALHGLEGNEDLKIKIDVSDLSTTEEQVNALDDTIDEMTELRDSKIGVDASQVEEANAIIQYCVMQKQLLTQPDVMRVDTTQVDGDLGHALSLLQQFKDAQNDLEVKSKIGADTSEAEQKLQSLESDIKGLSPDIKAKLGIDTTSTQSIQSYIDGLDYEAIVSLGVNDEAIAGYNPETKSCDVIYNPKTELLPESFDPITRTVKYVESGVSNLPKSFSTITRYVHYIKYGDVDVNGTAHAGGTAKAMGDWGTASGGTTLVGELGREIVVDPRTGQWYTVGDRGAEFRNIPKGAIVFNHLQTESLLANGYVTGRAHALASGTAMVTGGIKIKTAQAVSKSSSSSSSSSSKKSSSSSSKSSSSKKSSSSSNNDDKETVDWIEVLLDRWERFINNLSVTAESIFKTLSVRLNATDEEISAIANEIKIEYAAYERYIKEAESIALSDNLKQKVRDGTIDINKYSKSTAELISQYREWYEKALDCAYAIDELHESIADLYQSKFDTIMTDFENQLSLTEHKIESFNNDMDALEKKGYIATTKYYEAIRDTQQDNISVLNNELRALVFAMSEGLNSGEIAKGSEAWYEMQQQINSVKEAIQEAELEIIEMDNSIREAEWDMFEYIQTLISNITEEADFLVELMSTSDLFSDNGEFTGTGMATLGIHGQNYNVYMNQAERYADKIKEINDDIANDPNNTKLLEQKQEWLEAQRESILNAENEKQAIVSLVEEGIKKELEYLNDLIDAYKNSLDEAKDLYDYQKQVKSQSEEIAKLQKQLSAYRGDNSEENKTRMQKLQLELNEAVESLEETQYERSISEQKKILDNLYTEYEELLNSRLDNIDALISEMITVINSNYASISDVISEQSDNVGYTISSELRAIWESGGANNIITKYGDMFISEYTQVNTVLNEIAANVASMAKDSDEIASSDIVSTDAVTEAIATNTENTASINSESAAAENKATSSNTTTSSTKKTKSSSSNKSSSSKTISKGDKINAGSAKIYSYAGGTGYKQYYSKDPIYKVLKVSGDWIQVRHHKLSSGVTGWFKKSSVKKYKHGGIVDYTGLAQVDGTPGRPEAFLNADDTERISTLINTLRSIENGTASIFGRSGGVNDVITNLRKLSDPRRTNNGNTIGEVNYEITIPIEHVEDYDDFMDKMKTDKQFESMIQDMTIGQVVGKSKFSKNKYSWS